MLKSIFILLIVLVLPAQACEITQASVYSDQQLSQNCQLNIFDHTNQSIAKKSVYFVQFKYVDIASYEKLKMQYQQKHGLPQTHQLFKQGFRLFIGPLALSDVYRVQAIMHSFGYKDALIKYTPLTNITLIKSKSSVKILPQMLLVQQQAKTHLLLPIYGNQYQGNVTHYNDTNLGLFTYQQAQEVCRSADAHIANFSDYKALLSDTKFVIEYAAKSQFWLTSNETIRRINNKIDVRQHLSPIRFNVICATQ
ncbi:hypothetical protein [Vibrio algicola]|uniref:SPOR domain-containing protein n=1 Tax=Vibrio algicola TaxID=2662262 RepID=A0A5Q0TD91_9VIBR|nr:hypothetical protein [Vibrio algicola]